VVFLMMAVLILSLAIVLLAGAGCGLFVWIGAGCLVLGLRPRLTSMAVYGSVAWSFLMDLLGCLVKGNDLLRESSLFTHIKLAPQIRTGRRTSCSYSLEWRLPRSAR
jgi:putative exporter of polyketide antibiotics